MTTRNDMASGWRPGAAAALATLAIALSAGACGDATAADESSVEDQVAALVAEVGPDWEVVEDYLERHRAWTEQAREAALGELAKGGLSPGAAGGPSGQPRMVVVRMPAGGSPSEAAERLREAIEAGNGDAPPPAAVEDLLRQAAEEQAPEAAGRQTGDDSSTPAAGGTAAVSTEVEFDVEPPDVDRAAAAALAILEQDGAHEKTVEAAEFLLDHAAMAAGGSVYAPRGAKALLEFAPDYDGWPFKLRQLSMLSHLGPERGGAAEAVFEELVSSAEDAVLRAAGRYHVAAGRMRSANADGLSEEDRAARRRSALDAATGLSAGVEEEALPGDRRTFAEAEADLIRGIRHATVGSSLPDLAGKRLDGVEERLSDYRGRVLLLDFWATWCVPCVAALPQKRDLVAELPADRFALLSISVDAELDAVTGFMEDEPMPWPNWHVGTGSEVARALDVGSYPTYILVDEQGEILARRQHLPEDFLALVEETVEGAPEA